jgi:hypothetical protein
VKKKLSKSKFLIGYMAVVMALALGRYGCETWTGRSLMAAAAKPTGDSSEASEAHSSRPERKNAVQNDGSAEAEVRRSNTSRSHPIFSVPSYKNCFPDSNALQLEAARRWGVPPVKNRADAEARKKELVYIAASPYYHVDRLRQSSPYLVPRAAILLEEVGKVFFDSLYIKGVPLHRLIVTSVLRTQEDVQRLRNVNGNATENSCHLYGTTFDICYNRYETVENPDGPARNKVRNDTLKFILSEVLRDMRERQRCYVKYEVKQGCFHMTVR